MSVMKLFVQVRPVQHLDLAGMLDAPSTQEQNVDYELVSALVFGGGNSLQTATFSLYTRVAGGGWYHFSNGNVEQVT